MRERVRPCVWELRLWRRKQLPAVSDRWVTACVPRGQRSLIYPIYCTGALCPGGFRAWPRAGYYSASQSLPDVTPCAPPLPSERCRGWDIASGQTSCGPAYRQVRGPLCDVIRLGAASTRLRPRRRAHTSAKRALAASTPPVTAAALRAPPAPRCGRAMEASYFFSLLSSPSRCCSTRALTCIDSAAQVVRASPA